MEYLGFRHRVCAIDYVDPLPRSPTPQQRLARARGAGEHGGVKWPALRHLKRLDDRPIGVANDDATRFARAR